MRRALLGLLFCLAAAPAIGQQAFLVKMPSGQWIGYVEINGEITLLTNVTIFEMQPPQPTTKEVMFFVPSDQLDNLTMEQQAMVSGRKFRGELEARGHKFLGAFDPGSAVDSADAKLDDWWAAIKGDPMPRVAFRVKGGTIVDRPLPANAQALYAILEGVAP